MSPRDRRLRYGVLFGCLLALVASHANLIGYATFANVDEAYALALGKRILDGHRLYEGAISQRGPLMYYTYAAVARVVGWDNVVGFRLFALGCSLLQVGLVAWAGTRLVSHRVGTFAAAVLTYILVAALPPIDGIALHGETLQVPFLLVGSVLAFVGRRPFHPTAPSTQGGGASMPSRPSASLGRRIGLVFASGICFGAAIATKQSAIFQPIPVVLWLYASSRRREMATGGDGAGPRGAFPWRELGAFVAGIALLPLLFVAHAAATGTLGGLVYYCFTYNLKIHLRPGDVLLSSAVLGPLAGHVKTMTAFVAIVAVLLYAGGRFVARRARGAIRARSFDVLFRGFGGRQYVAAHALTAILGASTQYRFFPHYYLPALPFLALAVAAFVARLRLPNRSVLPLASAVVVLTTVISSAFTAYVFEKIDGEVTHGPIVKRVSKYVETTTAPESSIFVWGFSPWLYEYSHRKPAGRYVFETYVTGFVPWFFDALRYEKDRAVPGSLELLLGDLDREAPEVVVDAGSVLLARPMRAYPLAAEWLHRHYCFEVRVGAYDVYRRKGAGECKVTAFPKARPPADYWNAPMAVAMPALVDDATSRLLCPNNDDDAVWFAEAPPPAAGLPLLSSEMNAKQLAEEKALGIVYPRTLRPKIECIAP